jgi:hypothetical protein
MADLWRDFWIRESGTGQQVAQLHDWYMMMVMMMVMITATYFNPTHDVIKHLLYLTLGSKDVAFIHGIITTLCYFYIRHTDVLLMTIKTYKWQSKHKQFNYNPLLQGYMFRLLRVIIMPSNEPTQVYLIHNTFSSLEGLMMTLTSRNM